MSTKENQIREIVIFRKIVA